MVVVVIAMAVDGVYFGETEQTHRPKIRLADFQAATLERGPAPRASFRHPQGLNKDHLAIPRNCFRRSSVMKNRDHIYKQRHTEYIVPESI